MITPALKEQLAKAINAQRAFANAQREVTIASCIEYAFNPDMRNAFTAVRAVFARVMPAEQAKHATHKYLAK